MTTRNEDQQLDGRVQAIVVDPEEADGQHGSGKARPERGNPAPGCTRSQEQPAESVAEREEHEDHERDDDRHQRRSSRAPRGRRRSQHRPPARRASGPQQVGDQVDRAGGEHDAVGARRARARPPARGAGRRTVRAGGPPSWPDERLRASRRQRARVRARGEDDLRRTAAAARAASPAASLSSSTETTATSRPPAERTPRSDSASAAMPAGVVGAVEDRRRRVVDDLEAAGHERRGGRRAHGARRRARRGRPRPRRARPRSCAAGRRPGEQLEPGCARGATTSSARPRSAHIRSASAIASGCRSAPTTSVPPGRTTSSFSRAMSATVGPSQRVCSRPTFVSTCTARRDDVGRVAAPAEARPRRRRPRTPGVGELAVGGGGQRLELRDAGRRASSVRSTFSAARARARDRGREALRRRGRRRRCGCAR